MRRESLQKCSNLFIHWRHRSQPRQNILILGVPFLRPVICSLKLNFFFNLRNIFTYFSCYWAFLDKGIPKMVQIPTPTPNIKCNLFMLNWEHHFSTKFFTYFLTYSGNHSQKIIHDKLFFKKKKQIWIFQLGTIRLVIT